MFSNWCFLVSALFQPLRNSEPIRGWEGSINFKTNFSIDRFEAECCDFTECRWEPLCDRRNTSDYDLDLDDPDLNYDRGVDPIGHIDEEKTTRHYLDEDELFPWMVGAGILLGIIIILLSICLIWCHYNQRKLGKFSKSSTRKSKIAVIVGSKSNL